MFLTREKIFLHREKEMRSIQVSDLNSPKGIVLSNTPDLHLKGFFFDKKKIEPS